MEPAQEPLIDPYQIWCDSVISTRPGFQFWFWNLIITKTLKTILKSVGSWVQSCDDQVVNILISFSHYLSKETKMFWFQFLKSVTFSFWQEQPIINRLIGIWSGFVAESEWAGLNQLRFSPDWISVMSKSDPDPRNTTDHQNEIWPDSNSVTLLITYQSAIYQWSGINRDIRSRNKLTSYKSSCRSSLCGERQGREEEGGSTQGWGVSQFRAAAGHQLRLGVGGGPTVTGTSHGFIHILSVFDPPPHSRVLNRL